MSEETNQKPENKLPEGAVMSLAAAQAEVKALLDYKKIRPRKREKNKEGIDRIIDAVMYGDVTIDQESWVLTQKLFFPTKAFSELKFKPREEIEVLNRAVKGLESADDRIIAYAAVLTGQPKALIGALDSEDHGTMQYYVLLFF